MTKTLIILDYTDGTVALKEINKKQEHNINDYLDKEGFNKGDIEYMIVNKLIIKNWEDKPWKQTRK